MAQVKHYRLNWNILKKEGLVELDVPGRATIHVSSIEALAAFGEILRNEGPISFDPRSQVLSTQAELVGENE